MKMTWGALIKCLLSTVRSLNIGYYCFTAVKQHCLNGTQQKYLYSRVVSLNPEVAIWQSVGHCNIWSQWLNLLPEYLDIIHTRLHTHSLWNTNVKQEHMAYVCEQNPPPLLVTNIVFRNSSCKVFVLFSFSFLEIISEPRKTITARNRFALCNTSCAIDSEGR